MRQAGRAGAAVVAAVAGWAALGAVPAASAAPATTGSAGTISGVVSHAGAGVGSISVVAFEAGTTIEAAAAQTDGTGAYSLTGLAPGSYDLEYSNAGPTGSWLPGWYRGATSESTATPVTVTGGASATADITLRRAATISGVVRDPSGAGVGGIEVYLHPAGSAVVVDEVSTAADGTYAERNLPTGAYQLEYFPSSSTGSWLAGWYRGAADQAHATTITATAPRTVRADIRLRPAATIAGTTTTTSSAPVAGVGVVAYVAGTLTVAWEGSSAADGSWSLPNLAAGSYDIAFTAPSPYRSGWYRGATTEAQATPVTATPPGTTTIHIVLHPAG